MKITGASIRVAVNGVALVTTGAKLRSHPGTAGSITLTRSRPDDNSRHSTEARGRGIGRYGESPLPNIATIATEATHPTIVVRTGNVLDRRKPQLSIHPWLRSQASLSMELRRFVDVKSLIGSRNHETIKRSNWYVVRRYPLWMRG